MTLELTLKNGLFSLFLPINRNHIVAVTMARRCFFTSLMSPLFLYAPCGTKISPLKERKTRAAAGRTTADRTFPSTTRAAQINSRIDEDQQQPSNTLHVASHSDLSHSGLINHTSCFCFSLLLLHRRLLFHSRQSNRRIPHPLPTSRRTSCISHPGNAKRI